MTIFRITINLQRTIDINWKPKQ